MILYFSGTGNSLGVAQRMAEMLDEELYCMESSVCDIRTLNDGESLGIVFPVYAWGLPNIVCEFLTKMTLGETYVWTVMTCGDDMGYADEVLERVIGRHVDATFSVSMPNTYVCLPGFDVDSQELANKKTTDTERRLPHIAEIIRERKSAKEVTRGGTPWLKTYVLRPVFNSFLVTDKYFHTNANCTSCGLCAKQCPVADIVMHDGHPSWQHKNCTGCLRCYHHCPHRAIEWGRYTLGKGQKK